MIQEFLNYQKKDGELLRLEKELEHNEHRKQANLMIKFVKDATDRTKQLNEEATRLLKEFAKLEEVENKGASHVIKLAKQEISTLDEHELRDIEIKITNANKNLKELERRLSAQMDKVKQVLLEFENTKKKVYLARQKHKEHKGAYDAALEKAAPTLESLKKELKQQEKTLNKELFETYKELRKDGVFPILVPLEEKVCGGCRTNLPSSTIEKLKQNDTIRCENCRRLIYTK
jgi:predicted  nucleic acid-binding Zn-ribbon protein